MGAGSNAGMAGVPGVGSVNSTIGANSAEAIEALKSDMLMVYKAVIALEKRVSEYTVNMVEIQRAVDCAQGSQRVLPECDTRDPTGTNGDSEERCRP